MTRPILPPDPGYGGDPRRGASLGRIDRPSLCPQVERKMHMRVIKAPSAAYDQGGVYWGIGDAIYWAHSASGSIDHFVRAKSREEAKAAVLALHPGARFFR